MKLQLEAKAALFLSVIDRANKATRRKKETAAGANKQYTVQLFEGLLSDTFGIHKKGPRNPTCMDEPNSVPPHPRECGLGARRLFETGLELRRLRMYRG